MKKQNSNDMKKQNSNDISKYKDYTDTEYPFIKMKDGKLYFMPELDTDRAFKNSNEGTEHTWSFGIANKKTNNKI